MALPSWRRRRSVTTLLRLRYDRWLTTWHIFEEFKCVGSLSTIFPYSTNDFDMNNGDPLISGGIALFGLVTGAFFFGKFVTSDASPSFSSNKYFPRWVRAWLWITSLICVWDAGFVLNRGGEVLNSFEHFIWSPYQGTSLRFTLSSSSGLSPSSNSLTFPTGRLRESRHAVRGYERSVRLLAVNYESL